MIFYTNGVETNVTYLRNVVRRRGKKMIFRAAPFESVMFWEIEGDGEPDKSLQEAAFGWTKEHAFGTPLIMSVRTVDGRLLVSIKREAV